MGSKADSTMKFSYPPTSILSSGWKGAEKLKAVQKIDATSSDQGYTITAKKMMADIDATYIILTIKGKRGQWNLINASLTDEKGNNYKYLCTYEDCNIVVFEPLQDNPGDLTLTIRKFGFKRNPGSAFAHMSDTGFELTEVLPADVIEKLLQWGCLPKNKKDETPEITEKTHEERERYFYRTILEGSWSLTFSADTSPREKHTSIALIDRKIQIFDAFLTIKGLIKGLYQWVIKYEITDEKGRDEAAIRFEEGTNKIVALIRECSTREELEAKMESDEKETGFGRRLPQCRFKIQCGDMFIYELIDDLHNFSIDHGVSKLVFPRPEKTSPIILFVTEIENIHTSSPFCTVIALEQPEGGARYPFSIDLQGTHHKGALCINNLERDFTEEERFRGIESDLRRNFDPDAVVEIQGSIKQYIVKHLRIEYTISTDRRERIFFNNSHLRFRDNKGTVFGSAIRSISHSKEKWGSIVDIYDIPPGVREIHLESDAFDIYYNHGTPLEIPVA